MTTEVLTTTRSRTIARLVLLALVLGATMILVSLLLGGSNPSAVADQQHLAVADEEADADASDETSALDIASIPVTYDVFLERDPFEPVVPVAEEPDPVDPSEPVDPSDPVDPADPTTPTEPVTPGVGPQAELLDIGVLASGEPFAVIKVGNVIYEVEIGDLFAGGYVLIDIDGECATWLRGDTLETRCVGQVSK